jgi:Uri superfamily endonuclease
VDYLRAASSVEQVWLLPGAHRAQECALAAALAALPGVRRAPSCFGSSDCGCPGHLVFLPAPIAARRSSPG